MNVSTKPRIDLTGNTFNRLTFVAYRGGQMWDCSCSCGRSLIANSANVKNGHTKSCGCLKGEVLKTHGRSHSVEYIAWANMVARCSNPKHPGWVDYGARGIRVHLQWKGRGGFILFLEHIGERPEDGLSIDRIDNDGNYEPGNVKWSSHRQQMRNTRGNHWVEIDGRKQIISDWAKEMNIHITTIIHRIDRGMSPQDAVMVPAAYRGRRASKRAA